MSEHINDSLIEPDAAQLDSEWSTQTRLIYSIAISAKRIADVLSTTGVESLLDAVANHPVSMYGEGFAEAIQNSIERGQRGINTNDHRR